MDRHKISCEDSELFSQSDDSEVLLIMGESPVLNVENDTVEENQPLGTYRKKSKTPHPPNVFHNMKLCNVGTLPPTAYHSSFKT